MIQEAHFQNRHLYIGGSDVPIIMGQSKFRSAWDLLLEKAQIKDHDFGGNIYTAVGNLLEPRIQKALQMMNVDDITYKREYRGVPFACHIDGLDQAQTQIQEIKVVNQTMQACCQAYEWQIRTYMYVLGIDKARLIMLPRTGQLQKLVHEIIEFYDLGYVHDFNNLDQTLVEAALATLSEQIEQMVFTKKMLQTYHFEHDEQRCQLMLNKVRLFWNFKERLEVMPQLQDNPEFKREFVIAMNAIN